MAPIVPKIADQEVKPYTKQDRQILYYLRQRVISKQATIKIQHYRAYYKHNKCLGREILCRHLTIWH